MRTISHVKNKSKRIPSRRHNLQKLTNKAQNTQEIPELVIGLRCILSTTVKAPGWF
jgi:hypothetical protein